MVDIAIDLGTANTLIHLGRSGIVLDEPSVVAVERDSGKMVAVGLEAKRMLGRAPARVSAFRPMRGGAIADVDRVDLMLRMFLERVYPRRRRWQRPAVLMTIPAGITEMERRAVRAGIRAAGAGQVYMLREPIAAAVGAGLPVTTPRASMILNVGGGTTEIAVVALSGIVAQTAIRVGGQDLDDVITAYIRRTHNLLIGESTAESIKVQIGSAHSGGEPRTMLVKGRNLVSGIPATVEICSGEILSCMSEPLQAITAAVRATLEVTPPEMAADIVDDGLVLSGGGAQLRGLVELIAEDTGLPVRIVDDPATTVVRGAGAVLENLRDYADSLSA